MFLRLVVFLGLVMVVTVMLTQVIIPLWRDLPLFPWLRRGNKVYPPDQQSKRYLEWRDKGEE